MWLRETPWYLHPAFFESKEAWEEAISLAMERYSNESSNVINGLLEFGDPDGGADSTGNLLTSFKQIHVPSVGLGNTSVPFRLEHGLDSGDGLRVPRGWLQIASSTGVTGARVYDQIISSLKPSAYGFALPATLTVTTPNTITSGVANFINCGVQVGDEIKLSADASYPPLDSNGVPMTATVVAGSDVVTFTATPTVPPVVPDFALIPYAGWMWSLNGVDASTREVISYEAGSLQMRVGTPFLANAVSATGGLMMPADSGWRRISAVAAAVITLETTTGNLAGTACNVGSTCRYVIRRPPDERYVWASVISSTAVNSFETTLMFF